MNKIFVIGDVHGCINTLKELLKHWDKETEQLIFVGDLIDRGNFSPETVQFVKKLVKNDDAVCLIGNHEYAAIKCVLIDGNETWFREMGEITLNQYKDRGFRIKNDVKWFNDLPLVWQSEKFVISHAGIAKNVVNPFDKNNKDGVLWTRNPLKNIEGKIQIHGHTPHFENPIYTEESNSWNIDSAAVYEYFLTGLKFNIDGTFIEKIKIITSKVDIPRKYELSE